MSKRWGKKRVHNCECTYNFTCRPCLNAGLLTVPAVHSRFDDPKWLKEQTDEILRELKEEDEK